jgi:DNA-binding NarL/FixJ family response regulator
VRRIHILLACMPRMLLDMVTDIVAAHPEMTIVGKIQENADICTAAKRAKADIVILSETVGRQGQDYLELLHSRPHLKVLSIMNDGHRFFLHELRPFRAALGEISPESLLQAIRSIAQRRLG